MCFSLTMESGPGVILLQLQLSVLLLLTATYYRTAGSVWVWTRENNPLPVSAGPPALPTLPQKFMDQIVCQIVRTIFSNYKQIQSSKANSQTAANHPGLSKFDGA